ncbi:unnamed protein product, partial [Prorocentrum cordatum]
AAAADGRAPPPQLFDRFGRPAEVVFCPRGGRWRLRDFYELLVACRSEPPLAAAGPLGAR